ncbi:hypothetical protein JW921_10625 [Candidatus Fermentibacterales bacterium]|nr:hypothetical protein [Candidatus Fermentibacterales bacterium]
MSRAGPEEGKILAIAVTRDGKVVNKLIPGREPVRLGSDYNNNIIVEGPSVPGSMVLISPGPTRGTYVLRLTESMDARISSPDGTTLVFSDLRDLGVFRMENGVFLWSFKYGDQGQVQIGPYAVHFGYIQPPPPPRKEPVAAPEPVAAGQEEAGPADERVLRLIVTVGNEEKEIIPNAGIATIGEADYNTVHVRGAGLPRIHTLLEPADGKYRLSLLPEIDGGIMVKGKILSFQTLIERNLLTQSSPGEPFVWEFDKNVSGVFVVGGKEISFGFVEPPRAVPGKQAAPAPPAEIPREKYVPPEYDWSRFAARPHDALVCKGPIREASRFQMIIGAGIAIAVTLGAVCDRLIVVPEETITQMLRRAPSARVASLAQVPQAVEGVGEEIIGDLPDAETVSGIGTGGGGPGGGQGSGPAGVAAGQQTAAGVLQDIGFAAYGTGAAGGGPGFMSDLQSAASSGLGLHSGVSGDGLMEGSGGGGGGSGGITGLVGTGGGIEAAETVSADQVAATHRAASVTVSASATGQAIDLGFRNMSDIRARLGILKMRVQTAYESLLRSNPTAGGTITVNFSITPGGSVVGVSVSAPSELQGLVATVQSATQALNFGAAEGQTENLPVTVPIRLLPPE